MPPWQLPSKSTCDATGQSGSALPTKASISLRRSQRLLNKELDLINEGDGYCVIDPEVGQVLSEQCFNRLRSQR
jgi:hypothetical protein